MGQVVPFIARVRDSGDWTSSERARLEHLGEHLSAAGIDVEVIFGASEAGDPWCVVTDANGDVLIHVARIAGIFVVHSAVDDALSEGTDLHAALRDRLAATEEAVTPRSASVLPFDISARQAQTLLALVVATAFFYETLGPGGEAEAAVLPHGPIAPDDPPPPLAVPETDQTTQDREVTARAAAAQDDTSDAPAPAAIEAPAAAMVRIEDAPALSAPPEPVAPTPKPPTQALLFALPETAAPRPVVIQGTAGDDHLIGAATDDDIHGGLGNDTLEGGGGHDTLEGGAGDDRIELGAGVVAIGGEGADTFVICQPGSEGGPPHPDTFFGIVLDFNAAQGDRVVNSQGMSVHLTPRPDSPDPATQTAGTDLQAFTTATGLAQPLVRVEVDLDGDGVNDGYILVGAQPPAPTPAPATAPTDSDPPISVVGHSLATGDFFGG